MGFLCFLICVSVAMLRSKSKGLDGNLRIPVIQPCAPGHDQFFLSFPCWKSVLADVILFLLVQCCEMFLRLFLFLQFSVQFPQVIAHRIIELRRDLRISLVRMLLPKIWHHTRLVYVLYALVFVLTDTYTDILSFFPCLFSSGHGIH